MAAALSPRERLFRSLDGQPVDQVPVWLLFPYHRTGYYVDVRAHPAYRSVAEASQGRAIILDRRNLGVPLHAPEVTVTHETVAEPSCRGTRQRWRRGTTELRSEQVQTPEGTRLTRLVNSAADLEAYCSLPIETDPARIAATLDRQLPQYLAERAEFPPAWGAMMLDLGEPIGPLYHACNLEEYAIFSLTHAEVIEAWLARAIERYRLIYRWCLDRDLADVYFLVGSELASPPLVSRQTFQRWVVPFARELIALVHAYGKRVIQHYHGQVRELLPDFVTMAPDGLHTIEAPPTGNCTLTEAYRLTGERITLIGNLQYDDFRALAPDAMRRLVRQVLAEVGNRRFILSPTAGPFDPEAPQCLIRNYLALLDEACPVARG
jgi:uroporphyrinogen-III decarboxylase